MAVFDQAEIQQALSEADIRVLLMVLFQITGERRWLEAPFQPVRDIRLFADLSGGLSEELQAQVRAATLEVLMHGADKPKIERPSPEQFVEMMSIFNGEVVPENYAPLVLEEMGFKARDPETALSPAAKIPPGF